MKKINLFNVINLFLLSLLLTSCEVIEGIFKAGMGFGIFIVIAIIVIIVFVIGKMTKK